MNNELVQKSGLNELCAEVTTSFAEMHGQFELLK